MTLNNTPRCTGLTRDASRICVQRRECNLWLAYQRDLRTRALIWVSVRHMPDGFCGEMEREAA